MKYYKRNWDESKGDEYDNWEKSTWYLEVDEKGYSTRQIEKNEQQEILEYDLENISDNSGGLRDQAIDFEEFSEFEIAKEEFNSEWK